MKTISLLVPCFNEEENVENFYNEVIKIFKQIPNYTFELVFVDDGSKDSTVSEFQKIANLDSKVKYIKLSRNFGKEIALSSAIDYCTGDAAIPMDVDMQDPLEVILDFIKYWEQGYQVVYGVRKHRQGDSFVKKLTAHWFYRVLNFFSETAIPKDTGDFRLIDRKVIDSLKTVKDKNRFMKGIFAWVGFNQIGIDYVRKPRLYGTSKFKFFKLISLAIEGITSFSTRPLRLASYSGFLISTLSILYGIYIAIRSIILGADVPGYPSLIVVILFLGGVQLISIGLLGEYIGKIYNESKDRPLYIVNESKGF